MSAPLHSAARARKAQTLSYPAIQRRRDGSLDAVVATLHPGDYFVACEGEWITTVLGSCISACIRDPSLMIGGMNHFMLPVDQNGGHSSWSKSANAATRFGNVAMERLINDILKIGGQRERLECKLVGGGRILEGMSDVGERNVDFVLGYVSMEKLKVLSTDLGDVYPRKVLYNPATGQARVKRLPRSGSASLANSEISFLHRIDREPIAGEVELF